MRPEGTLWIGRCLHTIIEINARLFLVWFEREPSWPFPSARNCSLECSVCHPTFSTGELAQIPDADDCLNCHQTTKKESPAIQKLFSYQKANRPVPWNRLYKLPELVFFSHQKHVAANVKWETCHGQVQSRDVLWQERAHDGSVHQLLQIAKRFPRLQCLPCNGALVH